MKSRLLLTLVGICLSASIFAQSIKGRVEDEKKLPIVGATVMIEGTKKGTFTNESGVFEIKDVVTGKYKLKISSLGSNTS
jgi:iron complex outermembrane receptor protein